MTGAHDPLKKLSVTLSGLHMDHNHEANRDCFTRMKQVVSPEIDVANIRVMVYVNASVKLDEVSSRPLNLVRKIID